MMMKYGIYDVEESPSSLKEYVEGAHIIVLRTPSDYISTTISLEDEGWEVRDCIKIVLEGNTIQAGLFRKPFKGTVVSNVIKNGCGGINIDDCRVPYSMGGSIATNPLLRKQKGHSHKQGMDEDSSNIKLKSEESQFSPNKKGRFPANLILECTCEEVIKGENHGVVINNKNSKNINDTIYKLGHSKGEQEAPRMYKDEGDTHTDEKCPCYQLNLQSREGNKDPKKQTGYGDIGGASRYFHTFGDKEELKNYLISMINCDNV